MNWQTRTEDNRISLQDHLITYISLERDIIIFFEDGFDVAKDNVANNTGKHKLTGEAAVILYNGKYVSGTKYLPGNTEESIEVSDFDKIDYFEVLDFSYENETGVVTISGDDWDESVFSKLTFKADKVEYCWNEFVDDAWFQR